MRIGGKYAAERSETGGSPTSSAVRGKRSMKGSGSLPNRNHRRDDQPEFPERAGRDRDPTAAVTITLLTIVCLVATSLVPARAAVPSAEKPPRVELRVAESPLVETRTPSWGAGGVPMVQQRPRWNRVHDSRAEVEMAFRFGDRCGRSAGVGPRADRSPLEDL